MPRPIQLDDPRVLQEAAALLKAGKLVAFPTETVYGLGANALDADAVAGIFAAKGRPATNPLIVHVGDVAMARRVVAAWPPLAQQLADAFWPGPLTMVLPRRPEVPPEVSAGLGSVGVRMPAHPVALALIRAADLPIAAPSANPYMGVSPTLASHVEAGLGDRVAMILDGGPANVGLESTVLDLTREVPTVLRPGGLSLEALRAVVPGVVYQPQRLDEELARVSPGLARRHYAPKARVHLVPPADVTAAAERLAADGPVGVWLLPPSPSARSSAAASALTPSLSGPARVVLMPTDPAAYAAKLYAALHEADEDGLRHLVIALPPQTEAWTAVHDRLRRSAEP